jgi:hypothetical protein
VVVSAILGVYSPLHLMVAQTKRRLTGQVVRLNRFSNGPASNSWRGCCSLSGRCEAQHGGPEKSKWQGRPREKFVCGGHIAELQKTGGLTLNAGGPKIQL